MKNITITLIIIISMATLKAQDFPGNVKENVLRTTIKIEIPIKKSGKQPNGTGFLVSRPRPSKLELNRRDFFLITNKHVVGDWNLADGNIQNYYQNIDLFLYTEGIISSAFFLKKTINIVDSLGKTTDKLKLHPNPNVDIAIIDVSDVIRFIPDINLRSFDTTYLLNFDKILDEYIGIGDQVFALGYPLGITSTSSNLPIAKSCYISSLPGEEFRFETESINRSKTKIQTKVEGKLIIVDGLIVGGNSGGPVVMSAEMRMKPDEKAGFKYSKSPKNLVLGIVSMSMGNSGINIIYSSDYILELLEEF